MNSRSLFEMQRHSVKKPREPLRSLAELAESKNVHMNRLINLLKLVGSPKPELRSGISHGRNYYSPRIFNTWWATLSPKQQGTEASD